MNRVEERIVTILKEIGLLIVVGYIVFCIAPFMLIFGILGLSSGSYISGILMTLLGIAGYRIYWVSMRVKKPDLKSFREKLRNEETK